MKGEYGRRATARCDFCGLEHELEVVVKIDEAENVRVEIASPRHSLTIYYSMHNASRRDDASR